MGIGGIKGHVRVAIVVEMELLEAVGGERYNE